MRCAQLIAALSLAAASTLAAGAAPTDWQAKVDPWLLGRAQRAGQVEALILLDRQADLSAARGLRTKEEKGRYVFEQLQRTAAETQGPLLGELDAMGAEHRSYWVANMVWVRTGAAGLQALAERSDVRHLFANPQVKMALPRPTAIDDGSVGNAPFTTEWGVNKVNAPALWAQGFSGQGIVVGGEDTGYDWNHPALKNKYRGWNGSAADHNYNWHDSIHSGGGSCGANSTQPCDDNGHGTHTMGSMVGDDGAGNQVGVAPGARWIGCRNMDQGNGTPTTYSECFQFFIAPTDLAGQNPDPSKSPHVINNSWGCPTSEGCTDPTVLQMVVENTRAAGIVVVVSAGNSGSGCSTVNTPAAIYDAAFSVGATDINDNIASFSSRGPVTVDGSNRPKPDISGPGVNVRSSLPGGSYGNLSGTSMAGPHVVGSVALLLSASPGLVGDQDAVETCLEQNAMPRTSGQTCGGVPGTNIPNNTFGYGRVQVPWPLPANCLAGLFADGFETGDTTAWAAQVP